MVCSLALAIMTFHVSQSLVAFSSPVTCPSFSHFVSQFNIFPRCFPLLIFLRSFQLSQDVLVSLLSSHGQMRLPGIYVFFLFMSDLVCWLQVTLFSLISLQSIRFVAFFVGTTFLLPLVSFVPVKKLYRPRSQTSEWVQYSWIRMEYQKFFS